jgi:integrase
MNKGTNPNHPRKGSRIKVDPIRDIKSIQEIKELLEGNVLYLCFFVLGINTNLRASDLLNIKVAQVRNLSPMGELVLKEQKTGKERRISLNKACVESIQRVLFTNDHREYLFTGQRGVLTVPTVSGLVKRWCRQVGLKGNYGAHTLRKTWAYQQYSNFGIAVPVLMQCLNHSSERQTLTYIGIQPEEIREVYANEL